MGELLNAEQVAAVQANDRDILVLAGAGTGKTKTLVARAERLVKDGVKPSRILLLTFTKRAGEEMRSRMRKVLGDQANEVTIGTFHSWASSWLRSRPKEFGRPSFKVATADIASEFMDLARDAVVEHTKEQLELALKRHMRLVVTADDRQQNVSEDEARERLAALDAIPKNSDITQYWGFFRNTAELRERDFRQYVLDRKLVTSDYQALVLQGIVDKYEEEKAAQDYMDYDDMLLIFANGIRIDDAPIRNEVRGSYDQVLVDELQDTSPLQWLILQNMRNPAHLFAVGDDCQAIYAFRGADYRNVHDFQKRLAGANVLKLTTNYRSTQEILDVSNWLLSESEVKYDKKLTAHRGSGFTPLWRDFPNEFEEAAYVYDDIQYHLDGGGKLGDIMVMGRSGNDLRLLENILLKQKVPYVFIGGTSFLETRHIRDIICLLLIFQDHRDRLAWRRFLKMFKGIGPKTALTVSEAASKAPTMADALRLLRKDGKAGLDAAANILHAMPSTDKPGPLVVAARKALAPIMEAEYDDWPRRKQELGILEQMAEHHRSILGFLDTYTLETVHGSQVQHGDRDHLVLITVHSAKGTEAPKVFILNATRFPGPRAKTPDEIEEERRILYVAITRAQNELTICTSQEPVDDWFLQGMPDHLAD